MHFSPELIHKDIPLRHLVTFKLGGNADYFYSADSVDALCEAVTYARQQKMPFFILGGGSNLVVSDKGIEGLVIHNQCEDICTIDKAKKQIKISSGFELAHLVSMAQQEGFAGAESFAGIPGSIGGAICGNAGAYGRSVSDILVSCEVLTPEGERKFVDKEFLQFDYRMSRIKKEPFVVLSGIFQLQEGNSSEIQAKIDEILAQRHSKHPEKGVGCAGSYFKNLPPAEGESRRQAAGMFLEKVGAKQMHVGGAAVFSKHANFIINTGTATAEDVKQLACELKEKVQRELGISLEEEVRYVGRWPKTK